jgi:hypothetical protein
MFIACAISTQAQTNKLDEKLLVKYSLEELNLLKKDNPQEYEFIKYCVNNAFYVAALSEKKVAKDPNQFGEVTIKDLSEINFYTLNIDLKQSSYQAFVIKGANKLLMVKSKDYILQELKKKTP